MSRHCLTLFAVLAFFGCSESGSDPGDEGRTFVIPFAPYFGSEVVACGRNYTGAGTSGASFELRDLLLFVHDVQLVRANGERVPLSIVEDGKWQSNDTTLLDFGDGTGVCPGDSDTNDRVIGTAPDHPDYVGIAFGVGLPPELNHLDGVKSPAPFNKPSLWWSWKEGYKFFQLTLKTEVHEDYYVHVGATECEGTVESGFTCNADHEMAVEVADFAPGIDGVRLNLAALLAEVDLNAEVDFESGDFVAGCMSFNPDPECDPLFTKFGRHFMTADPGPQQVAFESGLDMAKDLDAPDDLGGVPQPGSEDFVRSPALDIMNVSERGVTRSHLPGNALLIGSVTHDRSPGSQCLACHQEKGPGTGLYQIAGTIWNPDLETGYGNATIAILPDGKHPCLEFDERAQCVDQPIGYYREEDVVATVVTDPQGNAYTTELPPGAEPPFWPVVVPDPADTDLAPKFMPFAAASGSCNMCHGGLRIQLAAGGG